MKSTDNNIISWHSKSINGVIRKLKTSLNNGLDEGEISKRLKKYGLNQLKEPPGIPWYKKILDQLNDYLIWILIGGAFLSIVIGEYVDGFLIITIVGIMALVGYIQDTKAERSLANLKKITTFTTKVLRNSKLVVIPTVEVVPGDVVVLEAGDAIPADLRVVTESNAQADEATLTGESLPVSKISNPIDSNAQIAERINMLYSGTHLVQGKVTGVVVATGMDTELGNIALLLSQTSPEPTPLEMQLTKLGKVMGNTLLAIVFGMFLLNIFIFNTHILESVIGAVALAIAAVPEGLPAVITVCLAVGTQKMVKKQALVRKLKAVEALGSVSIICTDKTGTLTTGQMSVTKVWTADKLKSPPTSLRNSSSHFTRMLRIATLCNNKSSPTETAIFNWAESTGLPAPNLPRLKEFEFNSKLKRMTCIHQLNPTTEIALVKGAPEILLEHSSTYLAAGNRRKRITPEVRLQIEKHFEAMASKGLRVLAFAEKKLPKMWESQERSDVEKRLVLIGLVGMSDPPKDEVKTAIKNTLAAGIKPVMITGDNAATAAAIGEMVGIYDPKKDNLLSGPQLEEAFNQANIDLILKTTVFARVTPEDKTKIVQTFQSAGHFVAMIGDGVNDAPAVKLANVGVSMGKRGSDVTKSAADLVLLDDNYQTLVVAVEEGRYILSRIRLFVGYLLSSNLAEIAIFVVAILLRFPLPLTAAMLLLLNIVTDAAPALAMSQEEGNKDLMKHPPRAMGDPIISLPMWVNIAWVTLAATVATITAFWIGLKYDTKTAQTMAFATISFLELFRAFTARSFTIPAYKLIMSKNIWIPLSVAFGFLLTITFIYFENNMFGTIPLPLSLLLMTILLALIPPAAEELVKPLLKPVFIKYKN